MNNMSLLRSAHLLMVSLLLFTGGCRAQSDAPQPAMPVPHAASDMTVSGAETFHTDMNICASEAHKLEYLNRKRYGNISLKAYRSIDLLQHYTTVSGDVSQTIRETVLPLYRFQVRDACNTVSQALLGEMKKGQFLSAPGASHG